MLSEKARNQTRHNNFIPVTPVSRGLLQRKCACGTHTMGGGQCAECQKNKLGVGGQLLQPKLTISSPGDVYEQEADRVVEQVMRMSDAQVNWSRGKAQTQLVQRRATSSGTAVMEAPPIVHEVLNSPGQPLDIATRAFFEPRFGHDFSQVRVHTGAKAAESARSVNAEAYTVGRDVVFGTGQHATHTEAGNRLLAHELAHTIQQRPGEGTQPRVADGWDHECEEDITPEAIYSHRPIPLLKQMSPNLVARQQLQPDEPLKIERDFEVDPQLFLKPMEAYAIQEGEKCEEFPGGSTYCVVDETTGIPTGKVTQRIDETNLCTRPCVEQHEAIHIKQLKKFCPELRDCYRAADRGTRPVTECIKMAMFGMKERECEAYRVSLPCVEKRLKNAKECQSKENKDYGTRKLASEKCFREKNCGSSGGK